ncbi:FYN-binding protein 1, partial [Candoia aspera]|uniref:FYN-binding protein 1 n=1 Tax=Candoia aspera TaxID=51853 RepID=UPI002FD8024F
LQDGKAHVKTIMAKFNNNPAEDVHCHQVRAGGHPPLVKKAAFEKFAQLENAGLPPKPSSFYKPASLKSPSSTKLLHDASSKDFKAPPLQSSPVASKVKMLAQAASREANERASCPKPLASKTSEGLREEAKPVFPKAPEKKLPGSPAQKNELKPLDQRFFKPEPQGSEAKPVFPTVAGVKEKFTSAAQENNPKPPFPKPSISQKPSQSFIQGEEASNKSPCFNQVPPGSMGLKPKVGSIRPLKDPQDKSRNETNPISPFPPLKPVSNQNNLPQILPKPVGQQNEEAKPRYVKTVFQHNKQEDSGSTSGTTAAKLANSSRTVTAGPWANNTGKEEKDKNLPRRKTLPPPVTLGPAPQKPNRPPTVDLEKFRKNHGAGSNTPHSGGLPPPLPPPFPATQPADVLPSPPPPPPPGFHPSTQTPVLPPRVNIPSRSDFRGQENEENYDDVGFGSEGTGNADENSDGEMYEDINDMRLTQDDKKKEKEEKKKSDQKKEQKDKDKKEQELRKKFKLEGPIEILHLARASTDFKGGKYDLTFRQGDQIEILRITDNPEGKWLGRLNGSYGYIKTTMVAIDYDSLKKKPRIPINVQSKHQDSDQEVYDDVGDQDSISSGSQSATGGFPPPPPDDIYDGVEDDEAPTKSVSQDEEKSDTWSKGLLKILKGKDYQKKSMRETAPKVNVTEDESSLGKPSAKQTGKDSGDSDVYDDVESTDFPPPPKEISLGVHIKSLNFGRSKFSERDSQKLKKIDKEERDFRKKFKYEGDIQVLYTITISRAPSPKKRGSKDLQVKPGELVEVIKNVDDTKVLCRNEEGKYGYVQRSCIACEDEEIYDDIADDCLYDND